MRYRSVAITVPKSRTSDIRYLDHKRNKNVFYTVNDKKVKNEIKTIKGSGVIEDADMIYLNQKAKGLKLAGQGLNPAGGGLDLPGGALKQKLIKESRGKDLGSEYSLKSPSIGMGLKKSRKLKGAGIDPVGLNKIQDILTNVILPKLIEKMGVSDIVPQSLISKVVETSTKDPTNTIKDIIEDLAKKIMPIITQSKLAQTGSGKHYNKIIKSKKYKQLHIPLKKYIKSQIKGQNGDGFFGDLWSGFKSVIKPLASIAGPIASVFFPEFAIPIEVGSKIIGAL